MSGVKKAVKKIFKAVTKPVVQILGGSTSTPKVETPDPAAVSVDAPDTLGKEAGMEGTQDATITKRKAGKRGLKISRANGGVGTGLNV